MTGGLVRYALAWAARGFRVFPLHPHTKIPAIKAFYDNASLDPHDVMGWWHDNPEYNIGVATDGLCVIDVDVKSGKDGVASYAALELPQDVLTVRTPSGGYHYYFVTDTKLGLSVGKLGPGLDTRSNRGYVVAPGSVTDEGAYTLELDAPMQPLPHRIAAALAVKPAPGGDAGFDLDRAIDIERARDWLESHPVAVQGEGGDAHTLQTFARLKDMGLSQLAALDLAQERDGWNDRCLPPWESAELARKAENAWNYARQRPTGCDSISAHFDGVALFDMPAPVLVQPAPVTGSPDAAPASVWVDHGTPPPKPIEWLLWGVLPAQGVGLMAGASGSGKTFAALHMGRCLAASRPFFGVQPDAPAGVAVLAAEGHQTIGHRMAALQEPHALPLYARPARRLATKDALSGLVQSIRAKNEESMIVHGVPIRLVILDTLAASGLVADENDNAKVSEAMAALFKLSQLLNAFVLVTHHPPKNGGGARGASAFFNDSDCVFDIAHDKALGTRTMSLIKSREGPTKIIGGFRLASVVLAEDDKGRSVTSCQVQEVPLESTRIGQTQSQNAALVVASIGEALTGPDSIVSPEGLIIDFDKAVLVFGRNNRGIAKEKRARIFAEGLQTAVETGAATLIQFQGATHIRLASHDI